ncbi:MAG: HPr family phosphocarrier protein [Planctomycetota bacterium]
MSKAASAVVTVVNKLGLHARPATLFAETASKFESDIAVRRTDQNESVIGKSVMQMMLLAGTKGTRIEITADGPDAKQAVAALVDLVESGFQED